MSQASQAYRPDGGDEDGEDEGEDRVSKGVGANPPGELAQPGESATRGFATCREHEEEK